MSRSTLALLALLALLLAPAALRADEPPAGEGDDAPAAEEPQELAAPAKAWEDLMASLRSVPRAEQQAARQEQARTYLEAWAASGRQTTGEDHLYLARFHAVLDDHAGALVEVRALLAEEGCPDDVRDQGATMLASALADEDVRKAVGDELASKDLESVIAYAKAREEAGAPPEAMARIRWSLGQALEELGRDEEATAQRVMAGVANPDMAPMAAQALVFGLLAHGHAMADYDAMRAQAAGPIAQLREAMEKRVSALMLSGDQASLARAQQGLERLGMAALPLDLLGHEAPAWTLEEAFGDAKSLEDLRGRVVVMDFWATWCPWCIRSFPAIRDLLRDLGDQGLSFVGVTTSAGSVYEARYDLDDDLKDKGGPDFHAKPAAMMDRGRGAPPGVEVLPEEEYLVREKEIIRAFIANHEMSWPVVMIDGAEPSEKYALAGWPHAVVVDRQGRIRYFKSGALLRDRPEQVAKFRAVLEDLLAEEAPAAGD